MSITIENKAGVAEKWGKAQSIGGGSKVLKNVKEAGKKGLNFLKSHKKEIAACLVFAAGVGLLHEAMKSGVNFDGYFYSEAAKHGLREVCEAWGKLVTGGSMDLVSGAALISKVVGKLQGNSSNTANVQTKANTGR